jgi:CubicO group peptidase (beta-lactamase class C family)
MTPHVSLRLFSALPLVAALGLHSPPVAAQSSAVTRPTPSLEERLDRLAVEIDRNRVDLHVPGAALAIVRGDTVIFARGFGLADVEKQTAMTPSTPLFIGSATKAFTATLVGMLVDEGRMRWDDPVEGYLPEFKLAVRGTSADDRATIRDVLGHRTGFVRMGALWANGALSSDEIYVVRLESAGLPPVIVSVDAETGDVLHEQRTVAIPGGGGLPMTTTYSDYRDVRGIRVPYRYVESNEQTGRTIYQVESVDVSVALDPDIFTLQRPRCRQVSDRG